MSAKKRTAFVAGEWTDEHTVGAKYRDYRSELYKQIMARIHDKWGSHSEWARSHRQFKHKKTFIVFLWNRMNVPLCCVAQVSM